MAFHTYIAHVVSQQKKVVKKSGECLLCHVKNVSVEMSPKTNIKNFIPDQKMFKNVDRTPEEVIRRAEFINWLGKVIFICLCLIFNIIFWGIAIAEYVRPAEEYI